MKSNSLFNCLIAGILLSPVPDAIAQTAHEGVNLGLSVEWATNNLDPEMNSDNLGYGYFWANPYYAPGLNATPYVPTSVNIGTNIAATNYDAAAVSWGDGWRLPTKAECEELAALKVQFSTTADGMKGFTVTAENGNSIFFEQSDMSTLGYNTSIWTADAYIDPEENTDYTQAYACNISLACDITLITAPRSKKYWIRPVRNVKSEIIPVSEVTLSASEVTLKVGEEKTLYPITLPVSATNRIVIYSSSDENVATIDSLGTVIAVSPGTANITATATDGSDSKGSCTVIVPDVTDGLEIDLGLSTIWAAYNVGATSLTDIGTYYQFANPAIVEKWSATVSPYVGTRLLPVTNMAGTQYDPATVNLGSEWLTPTQEQFRELIDNSDIAVVSGGFELTSKINGAKIFFPASGYMYVSALNARNDGYYMTAQANSDDLVSGTVPCVKFVAGMQSGFENITVTKGVPVRGVKKSTTGLNNISTDAETAVDIYNIMGIKVFTDIGPSHIPALAPGIYILRYASGKTCKIRLK